MVYDDASPVVGEGIALCMGKPKRDDNSALARFSGGRRCEGQIIANAFGIAEDDIECPDLEDAEPQEGI